MMKQNKNQVSNKEKIPELKRFSSKKQRSRVKRELSLVLNGFAVWQQRILDITFKLRSKYEVVLPSQEKLGEWVGKSRETVCRFMQVLKSYNLLTWVRRFKASNIYRINPIFFNISIINTFRWTLPSLILLLGVNISPKPDVTQYNEYINKYFTSTNGVVVNWQQYASGALKVNNFFLKKEKPTIGEGQLCEIERLEREIDREWAQQFESEDHFRREVMNGIPKYIENTCLNLTLAGMIKLCAYPERILSEASQILYKNKDNAKKPFEYMIKTCDNICARENIEPNYTARNILEEAYKIVDGLPMVDPQVTFKSVSMLSFSPVERSQIVTKIGFGKDETKVYGSNDTKITLSRSYNSKKELKTSLEEALAIVEDFHGERKTYKSIGQAKIALSKFTPEIHDFCRAKMLTKITGIEYTPEMVDEPAFVGGYRTERDIRKAINYVKKVGITANPYLQNALSIMVHQLHPEIQKNIMEELIEFTVETPKSESLDVEISEEIMAPRNMNDIVDDLETIQIEVSPVFEDYSCGLDDGPPIDMAIDDTEEVDDFLF